MASLNRCSIIGNVGTVDDEIRKAGKDETPVTNFSVAVNSKRGDKDIVTWFRCTAWGKLAEIVNEHVHKGMLIYVEGSISVDTYENKEKETVASLNLNANTIQFLSSKEDKKDDNRKKPGNSGKNS